MIQRCDEPLVGTASGVQVLLVTVTTPLGDC